MTSLNGAPVTPEQLESLGLVNYGHFTSFQVEEGTVRGLSRHLDRLVSDSRTVFGAELNREEIRGYIRAEVERSGKSTLGIRVTVFDPRMDMGRPSQPSVPSVLISVRPPAPKPGSLPPLQVKSQRYCRDLPLVKHIGLFGTLNARREAQMAGFDDALFVDGSAFISEGPTWNIGFHDGDQVIWPNAETLPGVTMRLLRQVHEDSICSPVSLQDIPNMHAAFATNVTIGVRAISKIDDVTLPVDAMILDVLRGEFEEIPGEEI